MGFTKKYAGHEASLIDGDYRSSEAVPRDASIIRRFRPSPQQAKLNWPFDDTKDDAGLLLARACSAGDISRAGSDAGFSPCTA